MKNFVSEKVFNTGVKIGQEVALLSSKNASRNSLLNLSRATALANQINTHVSNKDEHLNILNLSGINTGETDIFIKALLEDFGYTIDSWIAYDSPKNDFAHSPIVENALKVSEIELIFADFEKEQNFPELLTADVILVCDVIEHLDYSDALKLLSKIYSAAKSGAIVVVTCPNPLWIICRFKILFGNIDYFQLEISDQIDKSFYGHINIFDGKRLNSILTQLGFHVLTNSSFNHWRYTFWDSPFKWLLQNMLQFLTYLIPMSRFTQLSVVKKDKGE